MSENVLDFFPSGIFDIHKTITITSIDTKRIGGVVVGPALSALYDHVTEPFARGLIEKHCAAVSADSGKTPSP